MIVLNARRQDDVHLNENSTSRRPVVQRILEGCNELILPPLVSASGTSVNLG